MSTQMQPKTPAANGPDQWFSGDVYFDSYYAGEGPSQTRLNGRPSLVARGGSAITCLIARRHRTLSEWRNHPTRDRSSMAPRPIFGSVIFSPRVSVLTTVLRW